MKSMLTFLFVLMLGGSIGLAQEAPPASERFSQILNNCAQCHRIQCKSVDAAVQEGWIKPGDPDGSPLYTHLKNPDQWDGKMKAAVRLTDADTKAMYESIKGLKVAAKPPAAAASAKPLSAPDRAAAEAGTKRALAACAQCHRAQSRSIDTVVQSGRVKPGDPENSLLYKQVKSMHMKAATGLTPADAKAVYDYIADLKSAEVTSEPGSKKVMWRPAAGHLAGRQPGKASPAPKPDAFQASFHCLDVPTGAMGADPEEVLLRYQACDLAHQIAFLQNIEKLDLTKEQAARLLPYARQARELCEDRASELRDQWRAYAVMCNWMRKYMVLTIKGCDREMVSRTIGDSGFCGCPAYGIGRLDQTEDFYADMAAMGEEAGNAVLNDGQKEKLPEVGAGMAWVELPVQTRRAVIKSALTRAAVGPVGRLLMAPNAVAWLEKKAGQDPAAGMQRASQFLPLGAELIQRHRDMVCYDLRLVDGANVISGFNFTEKQLDGLINLLQGEMKAIHDAHAEVNKKSLRPMVSLLTEMRDDVAQGKGLAEEKKQKVVQYQAGICRGNYLAKGQANVGNYTYTMGSFLCPIHDEFTHKMEAIFDRLDGDILDDVQCKLLYETHTCSWFAPQYLSEPVRVGQVPVPIVYPELEVIANLRTVSAEAYPAQRDAFARQIAGRTLGTNARPEATDNEVKRAAGVLDKIRALPEADYVLNKYDLLSELMKKKCPEMAGGNDFRELSDADVKDLSWDQFVNRPTLSGGWSPYDLIKTMARAGKPVPSVTEKRVPYLWIEWPIFLREMPAYFLMDGYVVPSLETMRIIARNPRSFGPADLDKAPAIESPSPTIRDPGK